MKGPWNDSRKEKTMNAPQEVMLIRNANSLQEARLVFERKLNFDMTKCSIMGISERNQMPPSLKT